jgi:hypothetical protein
MTRDLVTIIVTEGQNEISLRDDGGNAVKEFSILIT